jgi:sterol desaturase/sphingolipid hydroxylase (fatty acid hydroxylase superfamily)
MELLLSNLRAMAYILAGMAALTLVELAVPLHPRSRANRAHLAPNLALTLLTFSTNAVFNSALVLALAGVERANGGLLARLPLPPLALGGLAVLALDLVTWAEHVAMHRFPLLWRFHRVHHSDPALDVTTTVRQHPGEGVIRYAFVAAAALPLGVSPAAYALYRTASALVALLEHANFRLPPRFDDALALAFTWPNLHKVHHSRDPRFTDTNYGNLVSWWDRLFGTFTPAREGARVACGLDGLDDAATQSTAGLLALPFRDGAVRAEPPSAAARCTPPA